jgi:ADP-ribosylglycohydrolase
MALPQDYAQRVYAGVLGKMIGVYLGRPFEGWSHERILAELGEIWYWSYPGLVGSERLRDTLFDCPSPLVCCG